MSSTDAAVAEVAAALNDNHRSAIDDPRKKGYKVTFLFPGHLEAFSFVRQLTELGLSPRTLVSHHSGTGEPGHAEVRLYALAEQEELLRITDMYLDGKRREALDRLVRSRSKVPEDVVERIEASRRAGRSFGQIASRMNELDVIDGRG